MFTSKNFYRGTLNLSLIILKNGQTYFKNLAVLTPQNFSSKLGHFSTSYLKGLSTFPRFLSDSYKNVEKVDLKRSKVGTGGVL